MDNSRVVVLGNGFLGSAYKRAGYRVCGREEFDWAGECIYTEAKLTDLLMNADVLVNTIGISDTRFCEDDSNWDFIHNINGKLPKFLSKVCADLNKKFIHISTGCLYDERNVPQKEDTFKAAHCNYVISKWIGEIGCNKETDLILRPRLLFDGYAPADGKRNNLLCKMAKFNKFVAELNTITSLDTIVEATEALLDANQSGVFNVGQTGHYSIAHIANELGLQIDEALRQEDLHKSQGLFLVNNIMDLTKLQQFYQPRDAIVEVKRCWAQLQEQ